VALHRVLIVDDTADVRLLVRVVLESTAQYEIVDEARDGREAIALATMHLPDVIVIDQMMPDLSGSEAVPQLRQAAPDARIVMFSAVSSSMMAERGEGADAYVDKGDIDALLAALTEVTARNPGEAPSAI